MNNEFTMSLTGGFGSTSDKVGITTTVKQQVQNIEITIEHFKKCIDVQKKQQSELDTQLQNLQKNTEVNLKAMLSEIQLQRKQLSQRYNLESGKENKQMDYLQLQGKILEDEQNKLTQLSAALQERVLEMEEGVGI